MAPLLEEPPVPLSEAVEAVGTLVTTRRGLVLRTDGGGIWELGHVRGSRPLLGCRVWVQGTRCGFNAIACRRLWRQGEPRPRHRIVDMDAIVVGLVVTSTFIAGAAMLFG